MNTKTKLLVAASVVVAAAWLLMPGRNSSPTLPARPDAGVVSAPAAPSSVPVATAPKSVTRPSSPLPMKQEEWWRRPVTEPPFIAFANWAERYAGATPADRAALEAEGVSRARARRTALADLIQKHPERALELAVPEGLRRAMPAAVRELLEERVNTRAEFNVLGVLTDGGSGAPPPVVRFANIGGETCQVFTFGAGERFVTKKSAPLNGIAVPASAASVPAGNALVRPAKLLALNPNPVRVLDDSEVNALRAVRANEPVCAISSQPVTSQGAETVIQVGGEIHSFCGKVHAEDWASAHVAASGLDTPGSDLPVLASPYTEGRKRLLMMLPIFTDYSVNMTTNEAVGHFVAMSNYLAQMSYGKHLFAGLGQGSDITPLMTLSGPSANYANNGLGALFNESKTVAQNTYGYNLSQYDFIFVVTDGHAGYPYCGLGYVGGVGFHTVCWDYAVSVHEFGHNLGLLHAHFWDTAAKTIIGSGQNVEYGDNSDPMGGGGDPNQYGARSKNYLGWIPDSDVTTLTNNGLYRLHAFDGDYGVGVRSLKRIRTGAQNYWLQFRQRKTSKNALMNGVQLLWTGNGNEGSYLLDARLKGDADDNAIVIGRTFSDTNNAFHFTPVGKGHTFPESIDVQVYVGTFPTNLPPVATIAASPASPAANQTVSFSATASDPNGDALAYHWNFGDGGYSVDNSATTTHTYTANGEYAAQCTVSDMKGGTARHTLIVRVGSPSTFRISGHVLDSGNRPVSGARIIADTSHSAFSDSDGSYTIVNLNAGTYYLECGDPVAGAFTFTHQPFQNPVTLGPGLTNYDFVTYPAAPGFYTPFISKLAAGWLYNDQGVDLGSSWVNPTYTPTNWSTGSAILGYGQGNETTTLGYGTNANNKYPTYYFRKQFTVADPTTYTNFLLEVLRDDGVVVYLNGVEVFRNNLPGGPVTYATLATSDVEPDRYYQTVLSSALLVAGTNTIAAEVHQVALNNNDLNFDLALSGLSTTNAAAFRYVYFTTPADNAAFTTPTNLTLTANAVSGGPAVSLVEFYADGAKIGGDAVAPYSFTWNSVPSGTHALSAVATIGGIQSTSPPIQVIVAAAVVAPPPPVSLPLIATGAVWRYYASSNSPSGAWQNIGFNDAGWSNGAAQLGYGEGDEATVLPYGGDSNNKWISSYFRRTFTVADPSAVTNLAMLLKSDDGAVVYLNGVEMFRDNMPAGAIVFTNLASTAVAGDGQSFNSFTLSPAGLVPGTNVLAVEIHQSSPTSSDVSFDLSLDATASTNRPRGIWLTSPTNGTVVNSSASLVLAADVVAGGTLGVTNVVFYSDGSPVGTDTSHPFTATWASLPGGAHSLLAVATDSAGGSITSAPVNITITAPLPGDGLISFGDVWKYLDNGSDQGTNWSQRLFNDAAWNAGAARLGYGGDGETTTISYGANSSQRNITAYFRRAFTVTNPAAYTNILLRLVRDDGAVVYLNGVEIFRTNLQSGLVSWNSLALNVVDPPAETTPLDVLLPATGLQAGTNVIAVELHQQSITSSDAGFDLALIGLVATNTTQGVYLTSPVQGQHFNPPAHLAFAAFAAAPSPVTLVEYFDGAVKVGQSAVNPFGFVLSNATAGAHAFTARATAGALSLTSAPVNVVVGPPPPPISPVFDLLIASRSSWKFWDNAAAVAANWSANGFDDATWPAGNTRFGWGLDGELTLLTNRVAHYFRRAINVVNPAAYTQLVFQLARDDGAVVYLNGVEIFRSNMPPGPVTAATLAASTVNTPDETTFYETILPPGGSGLIAGTNIIAVELHQSSTNSGDGAFDLQLFGIGTTETRVSLTAPQSGVSYAITSTIPLLAFVQTNGPLTVSKVEFFLNGTNKLGEKFTAPWAYSWETPPLGTSALSARATFSDSSTLDSAPVNITVAYTLVSTQFLAASSVWNYHDKGQDLGTNWSQPGFNDAGWSNGAARLGYGDDGEITLIGYGPNPNAKYITTYFRRSFVVPDGLALTNLFFNLLRDDGAVVWLNGREVYRSNMPNGPVTSATLAFATVSGTDEQAFFPTNIAITNLPPGTNILGVEVHQILPTSSDLGFVLEMTASGYVLPAAPPPRLTAVGVNAGQVTLAWPAPATGYRVYRAATVPTTNANWLPVNLTPVVTNGLNVLTITPAGPAEFYRLGKP